MTFKEVMTQLEEFGNEQTKKTLMKHGAREPFFGVKVEDIKKIQKKVKKDYELSLELYNSGNSDAMYLAGLIADEKKMTKEDLQNWVNNAYWYMLSEYTVAWIAAESNYGWELALEWIISDEDSIAAAGWSTLSSLVAIKKDDELNTSKLFELLEKIPGAIKTAGNREKYTMNGFVISLGSYVPELTDKAIEVGSRLGKVEVDMGGTACKVPQAKEYIEKVKIKGRLGKKRKMARC